MYAFTRNRKLETKLSCAASAMKLISGNDSWNLKVPSFNSMEANPSTVLSSVILNFPARAGSVPIANFCSLPRICFSITSNF